MLYLIFRAQPKEKSKVVVDFTIINPAKIYLCKFNNRNSKKSVKYVQSSQ